mgnify:FL=1
MRAYVFEDIDIGGGYSACIAVSDLDGLHVVDYMAVSADGRFFTNSSEHACQDLCELWVRTATENRTIQDLHAEQMRRIRGRRALTSAVERTPEFDAALGGQTLAMLNYHSPHFAVDMGETNDTLDADWKDVP